MSSPLNKILYERLQILFGKVYISNPGTPATYYYSSDIIDNRLRLRMNAAGEYYRVSCPFCHETRNRLWINHLFGIRNDNTGSRNLWLAICFNENCLAVPGNSYKLFTLIYSGYTFSEADIAIKPDISEEIHEKLEPSPIPDNLIPLRALPTNHAAIEYIKKRNLSADDLADIFSVSYCDSNNYIYSQVKGRLFIPIIMENTIVGWQARYIDDVDWKSTGISKYYNFPGMKRRLMLYNYDNACKNKNYVVLCEGPSDVWSVGQNAVATFGKNVSAGQIKLLCDNWDNIIIFFDADAITAAEKTKSAILHSNFSGGVDVVTDLYGYKDPGEMDKAVINQAISDTLTKIKNNERSKEMELNTIYANSHVKNSARRYRPI